MNILISFSHVITFLSSVILAGDLQAGVQLNENNFYSLTQHGLWFFELYSPFCSACKHFAPTWIELVDQMKQYEVEGLKMGQVDCVAQGDLCVQLGVNSYPTMKLYEDGKAKETYSGDKTVESIKMYLVDKIESHRKPIGSESQSAHHTPHFNEPLHSTPSPETYASDEPVPQAQPPPVSEDPTVQPIPPIPTDTPLELPNPNGWVTTLTPDNWKKFTDPTINPYPIFIQFHTAWCKECRKVVPVWEEVARLLKNEVNVADVDCEAKWNKKLCKTEHVKDFPTFLIHHEGTQLGYSGPMEATSMIDFIRKTVATPGTHEISMRELDHAIKMSKIFFLFLHTNRTPYSIVNAVQTVGKSLLGSAFILKSDQRDIYDRLGLSSYHPYLLVFKEGEPTPFSKIVLEEASPKKEPSAVLRHRLLTVALRHWIAVQSIPILDELDQRNFHRVLASGAKKLVVIAILSGIVPSREGINLEKSNPKSVELKDEMKGWALQWRKSQEARGVDDLTVDWVWVNSEIWANWLSTTYGVNLPRPTEDPRDSSMIIIVDAKHHRYFDSQEDGRDIEFKPSSVFQTLLAVEMGKLSGKASGTFMSRMSWRINQFTSSISFLFQPHWLFFWAVLFGIVGFTFKSQRRISLGRGSVGFSPISPQMTKSFHSSIGSPDTKSPGFGSVFGLSSNVPCKSD
ncbi:hypothetical protein PTTG_04015 [Puccinia triticina 1-1 BBBD Race 1]|uniref:Thioredoxin domain-containing protein n=2 Tax=Puccinia triticina TaxID=208348 RepID=A0A180H046_PUCT1|nr:uncharacterized protein PtA15_9A391 [Puccinia triticina]OAV98360.1 hypothetical protein PTTG_04015 [Puccinia triticina 1-1 BBBD Race 1]WAQ88264.1 hypothetical protein PtA15_9A391 [Puccinia triticina]WAR60436.1 hypothetical protein PtB15_9B375 [Puccinia triticina]